MKFIMMMILSLYAVGCSSQSKKSSSSFDAELSHYKYPFQVHFFEFSAQKQNLKMAYMDLHPALKPIRTLVLLHGKNFSGYYFADLTRRFLDKGYRVVVIDQIGFGKSSKPSSFQYSFQALAHYTQALVSSLGIEQYDVLGHSMGGMLAARMALSYPQHIRKLFLVNPLGLEDWKTLTSYKTVDELHQIELANTAENIKNYQLQYYYNGKWKPEYDAYIEIPTKWLSSPDHPRLAWTAALTSEMIFTQPVIYEFKNLSMPVVMINGTADRTAIGKSWAKPEIAATMGQYDKLGPAAIKLIAKGKYIPLKNLGHSPFIEEPEIFWQALVKELD